MAATACGQATPPGSTIGDDYGSVGRPDAQATGDRCATPNEGCSCESYGAAIDCGQVHRQSDGYVSCSLGKRTCVDGRWGACVGDRISGDISTPPPGQHPLTYGGPTACVNNPCDPYCVNVIDNATGLDAGAGLGVADGGLVLVQQEGGAGVNPCTGLTISPGPQTITVTGISPLMTVPASLSFAAKLSPATCASGSVPAAWSVSNEDIAAVGSDGKVQLYVPVAANMTVTAYAGSWVATTTASVVVSVQDKSMVSAPTAAIFDGAPTGTDTATVLYPYANTVFPRAVKAPVLQWDNAGTAATAVKYFVRYPTTGTATFGWSSIIPESATPTATFPQEVWSALDQTAKGADALIGIQRVVGGQLRPEITRPVRFSIAPLRGQIYYTEYARTGITPPALGSSCSFGLSGSVIRSLDPTGSSAPVNPFETVAPGGCPVCHSVAANGRMFVTSNRGWGAGGGVSRINTDGTFTPIADSPQPPKQGDDSRGFAFAAITPDGQYVLQGSNLWGNTKVAGSTGAGSRLSGGNGNGLYADYFAGITLGGAVAKHRIDTTIDFSWGAATPDPAVPAGGFSARWTGQVQPYTTETYTIEIESSDGARVWIDGVTVIDTWTNHNPAVKTTGTFGGISGKKHDIKVEYYESTGAAVAKLRWSSPQTALEIIPETQLYAR